MSLFYTAIRIGFQQPSYTVSRPAFEHYFQNVALLTIEDNRESEQTFHMVVEVVAASPSPSISVVSEDMAHNLIRYGQRLIVLTMSSGDTEEDVPFELIPYNLPPQPVAFEIVVSSEDEPFFLPAKKFHQSTFIIIEAGKNTNNTVIDCSLYDILWGPPSIVDTLGRILLYSAVLSFVEIEIVLFWRFKII